VISNLKSKVKEFKIEIFWDKEKDSYWIDISKNVIEKGKTKKRKNKISLNKDLSEINYPLY